MRLNKGRGESSEGSASGSESPQPGESEPCRFLPTTYPQGVWASDRSRAQIEALT